MNELIFIKAPPYEWIKRIANNDFPNGHYNCQEANWAMQILGKSKRYNVEDPITLEFFQDFQLACRKYLGDEEYNVQ